MPQALQYADLTVPIRTKTGQADAKFVPVCFSRMPDEALSGLPLYMRVIDASGTEKFTLYAGSGVKFTPEQRLRLQRLGISFVHILSEDQPKLRRQLEARIETLADDSAIELAVRCEIIYESSIELIDETLTTRNLAEAAPRLLRVARSIVSLYLEDAKAFVYLFAAARHDACTSTHAANAAAWMPALAMELGETQREALTTLCMGALVYDIGMVYVPAAIRNRKEKLNATEKQQIRQHPELGAQLLRQIPGLEPIVAIMALQHQERLDGSGYPHKLTFDQIHQAARLVAVVDTFDALTSFRPYREQGISPAEALETLKRETPNRYDPRVVGAWSKLLQEAYPEMFVEKSEEKREATDGGRGRRRFERFSTNCPAIVRTLTLVGGIWTERTTIKAVAHNLSRGGLGFLSRTRLNPGEYFRAQLQAKDGVGRTLTGMIVRMRKRDDGLFEAGARFVDLAQEAAPLPQGEFVAPEYLKAETVPMVEGECVAPSDLGT